MSNPSAKTLLITAIIALITVFFLFDLDRYLTLGYLKSQQQVFQDYYQAHRLWTLLAYFLVYVLVTALSLPGAAVMTLAGGALFGFWPALLVVSFASTIGATLAMLVARFLLRDWVQGKFGDKLKADQRRHREGRRLLPLHPAPGAALPVLPDQPGDGADPLRAATFYWVSQLGMLAGTAVYVNAGTRLGQLESAAGILSPALLALLRPARHLPAARQEASLAIVKARQVYDQAAQAEALRLQPGGDRRRLGRAGLEPTSPPRSRRKSR